MDKIAALKASVAVVVALALLFGLGFGMAFAPELTTMIFTGVSIAGLIFVVWLCFYIDFKR